MKPSEKINQILNTILKNQELKAREIEWIDCVAIVKYLDEEYTKDHRHEVGMKCNRC